MSSRRSSEAVPEPSVTENENNAAAAAKNPKDTPAQPVQRRHAHNARHLLTVQLFDALCTDFEAHGADAIRACREEQPQGYLRLVASLMPKELDPNDNPLKDLLDGEVERLIELLRKHLRGEDGTAAGEGSGSAPH
jgi:hypothetical protein